MNILFFLTPKEEVAYLQSDATLRQALEKMEYHRYASIPLIDAQGKYIGTITEGDLLWAIKNEYDLNLKNSQNISIQEIRRMRDYVPVHIASEISEMVKLSMNQNFIPVVDDQERFIGIVTRKDILQHFISKLSELENK